MAKTGIPRDPKIYFSLFVLFVLLLLMMPRTGKFNYDYKKGFNDGLNWFQTQLAKYSREVKVNGAKEVKKKK